MSSLEFFDCNAYVGQCPVPHEGEPSGPRTLAGEMKRCGIARALVHHTIAAYYAPDVGNQALIEACERFPVFVPCFVALPHHTGEFPAPEAFVQQLSAAGVGAVRLFPSAGMMGFSLSGWSCGELFDVLSEVGVPVFVSLSEIGWDGVNKVLDAHPRLALVVTHLAYRVDRELYPLLARHPNLRIETSGYQNHWGIESVVERFGAERLLFGTQMPRLQAGSSMANVAYAQISDDDRQLIAAGNLERLLGTVKHA